MKKVVSIILSLFLLVSGLHLTLATHICGGEVAAVKWSVAHENASCGMQPLSCDASKSTHLKSNCCHDEIRSFSVDSNYSPSSNQEIKREISSSSIFFVPTSFGTDIILVSQFLFANFNPPQWISPSEVSSAEICVYRN